MLLLFFDFAFALVVLLRRRLREQIGEEGSDLGLLRKRANGFAFGVQELYRGKVVCEDFERIAKRENFLEVSKLLQLFVLIWKLDAVHLEKMIDKRQDFRLLLSVLWSTGSDKLFEIVALLAVGADELGSSKLESMSMEVDRPFRLKEEFLRVFTADFTMVHFRPSRNDSIPQRRRLSFFLVIAFFLIEVTSDQVLMIIVLNGSN